MIGFNPRDEREVGVDLAADRVSYLVLAFGVLVAAAWRGFNGEAAWDLLALVVAGGAAGLAYRVLKGAVTRSWIAVAAASFIGAALVAALVAVGGIGR
jgi:hypothetical protein